MSTSPLAAPDPVRLALAAPPLPPAPADAAVPAAPADVDAGPSSGRPAGPFTGPPTVLTAGGPAGAVPGDEWLSSFDRDVLVASGRSVRIRPSTAGDVDAMRAFYGGLSDDSLYRRFFHARPKLLADRLHPVAGNHLDRRVVLLALDGPAVVGVGEYWRRPDAPEAEVAFAVADDHHHLGIATLLLEDLAVLGRAAGLRRLVAETMVDNEAMLRVFRTVGLPHRTWYEDGDVKVELALDDPALDDPACPAAPLGARADDRDWTAAVASLEPLLAPAHVVVIGAGRDPRSVGRIVLANLLAGFRGQVSVVHPTLGEVDGVVAARSVGALGSVPDLAVIAVPAAGVAQVVEECGAAGVRGAVVISAGFAETGPEGAALQAEVLRAARRHGMRLIGPNCLGIASTATGLNATFVPGAMRAGGISIASQSGGVGVVLASEIAARRLGVADVVSLGDKADVSGNDLLRYWAGDPRTRVIAMYLESLGDPQRFARVARAVSRSTPVVALKSGRTAAGSRAARSHTAALATDDAVVDALFRHTGVVRADTLDELLDVATLLEAQPAPAGRRVALVGNSGGPLILAADAAAARGLDVVQLSPQLQARLRALAPEAASTANPVDLLATATLGTAREVMATIADSGEVDAVALVAVNLGADRVAGAGPEPAPAPSPAPAPGVAGGSRLDWGHPVVPAVAVAPGWRDLAGTMPQLGTPDRAMAALAKAAWRGEWLVASAAREERIGDEEHRVDPLAVRRVVRPVLGRATNGWLPSAAAYEVLHEIGVPVAPWRLAPTGQAARAAAREMGFPCVVKAEVAGVVHKSDVGAVALGVDSDRGVRRTVAAFRRRFGRRLRGFLVQRAEEPGIELLIGAVHDPAAGPLLLLAAGGTRTELLADREILVAPARRADIRAALARLRMAPLLRGYRGAPAVDVEAIVGVAERLGVLIAALPEVGELDVNPVIARPEGCVAVDVRVATGDVAPQPLRALRGPNGPGSRPPSGAA